MKAKSTDIKLIFSEALERGNGPDRAAYLERACGPDAALRKQVEILLKEHERVEDDFLECPPIKDQIAWQDSALIQGIGTMIGPYKLLEKIGEGGMAVVYMAEQLGPIHRKVALKLIKPGMDTRQVIARFEGERQALAMMDHPNIARVFDAGATDTGCPYFVMELVKGVSITEFCDDNHLNTRKRLELFISVCQAVHHAHQKGIIHRDIKPSNIMVTLHDGEPVVKVIDFGIAKAINQQLTEKTVFTRYAQMIGTPEYMSPEQAEMSGLDVDTRTDVFSLGVLLYQLLTGTTPFNSEYLLSKGYGELQRIIREEEPVRPSTKISTLGETATDIAKHRSTSPELLSKLMRTDLDWIVMKTLEKNRNRRYESVSEFAADIRHHLNHEPVQAGPPSAIYKVQKFVDRNRLLVTAAAAIVVILAVATTISLWQMVQANRTAAQLAMEKKRVEVSEQNARKAERQAEQEKLIARKNAYASKMQMARMDWERGNISRLQKTLVETENYTDRGFEWYYWQRMCHLDMKTLRALDGPVYKAIYSPDGMSIASSSGNKVHIWDARTGTEITTYEGHKAPIRALEYSPDGQWLVTVSGDRTARIWDTKTGKELKLLQGHTGEIHCLDISSDGRLIATGSGQTILVWDAAAGHIKSSLRHTCMWLTDVAFSPDGQQLASSGLTTRSSGDDPVIIWDLSTDKNILALNGYAHLPLHVEYLPDGQRLVHSSWYGRVGVWNLADGSLIRAYEGHMNNVNFACASPDGKMIVSGSVTGTLKIWDSDNGKDLITYKGHTDSVTHAEFSPDGERIVSSSLDGTIRIWNAMDDPGVLILPYDKVVTAMGFSPNNRWLAVGYWPTDVKIWDAVDRKLVQTLSSHGVGILSVVFSPDGTRIATSSEDGAIKIWDTLSGSILLNVSENSDSIHLVLYMDNQRLVGGGSDGTIRVWDAKTGQLALTMPGHSKKINDIAVSPDGRIVGSIYEDGTIALWDSATGQEIYTRKAYDTDGRFIAFSPDGEHFASGGSGHDTLKVWNVENGQELFSIDGGIRYGIAYSPDGKRLACGDRLRGKIHIIDALSGEEFLVLNTWGTTPAMDVAFSSDGKRIASRSFGRTVSIYQSASEDEVKQWRETQFLADKDQAKRQAPWLKEDEERSLVRLSDEGAIKSWLILDPIPADANAGVVFEEPLIADEANLRPKAGNISLVNGHEYVWNQDRFNDATIDFTRYIQRNSGTKISYAVCYIKMNAAREGVFMKADCNQLHAKIYLNGKLIYESGHLRQPLGIAAELSLKPGINVVVLKSLCNIETEIGKASLWFVDSDGNPLEGLTMTLDPNDFAVN
ncbi:MAG: protein kinase [Phycisphaerae bacterium]|nr:protein kinase [Phycisphaerae bacterium]